MPAEDALLIYIAAFGALPLQPIWAGPAQLLKSLQTNAGMNPQALASRPLQTLVFLNPYGQPAYYLNMLAETERNAKGWDLIRSASKYLDAYVTITGVNISQNGGAYESDRAILPVPDI